RGTVTQLLLAIQAARPKPAPPQAAAPPRPAPPPPPPEVAAAKPTPAASPVASAPLAPQARPAGKDHTLAIIAYSASGALAVTGALFGLAAQVRYDNLKKLQGQPGYALAWETRKDNIKKAAGAADLAYLGAAVAAGAGTWLWFREERIAVGPAASPGAVGLVAAGTF
ncbi:MAG TPA: hypothetical protein VH880_11825, partial [Anaeromyxobacteraceae bacterium]